MAKSADKEMSHWSRMSAWRKEWWCWLKSRERKAASLLWDDLQFASLILFIIIALLNVLVFLPPYSKYLSPSGILEQVDIGITLTSLGLLALFFLGFFILIFILSFHPKTRKCADKRYHFRDVTKMQELEMRVSMVESGLVSINERLDKVENQLNALENRLGNIENTLGSIKATIATLVGKQNKAGTG